MSEMLLRGLILGFSMAAPVGPIGLLCIRRSLNDGRLMGFVTGLGAATADAFYGAVAAFGLTALSGLLLSYSLWIRLVGGLFLLYLGFKTWRALPAERPAVVDGALVPVGAGLAALLSAYSTTILLTLTNPMTIMSFMAIFASLGLEGAGFASSAGFVGGVFLGSALWWLLLSGGAGMLRARLTPPALRWVNRISGFCVVGFACLVLINLL